ncbi:MAG: hypothetical protein HY000_38550 [Planctomycetes bacterium]|nr:hypothetical protein [Planctomycetota bacterium]
MLLEDAIRTRNSELEQSIERQVIQRTWGRIHRLQVKVSEDRVVVHGCTSCYYVKQLALEGVLDAVGPAGAARVELDIEVAGSPASSTNARDSRAGSWST